MRKGGLSEGQFLGEQALSRVRRGGKYLVTEFLLFSLISIRKDLLPFIELLHDLNFQLCNFTNSTVFYGVFSLKFILRGVEHNG